MAVHRAKLLRRELIVNSPFMLEPTHQEPPECVQESFPHTWFYPKWRLVCSFPQAVLDETRVERFIEYLELEESEQIAPFDRYIDFSGLTATRLGVKYLIRTARRRRMVRQPSKTAFFASQPFAYRTAQMYEMLMHRAMIEVRAFQERAAAANWLDVPLELLSPVILDGETTQAPAGAIPKTLPAPGLSRRPAILARLFSM